MKVYGRPGYYPGSLCDRCGDLMFTHIDPPGTRSGELAERAGMTKQGTPPWPRLLSSFEAEKREARKVATAGTTAEENKAVVRRYIEEVWNRHDLGMKKQLGVMPS